MKKNLKSQAATFLAIVLVCTYVLASAPVPKAQTSTTVNGILTADTTWTKSGSPYTLAGPVAVNTGVTLTIEAGASVNLNGFYLQVNGTLRAQGSAADQIRMTAPGISSNSISMAQETDFGPIIFNPSSTSWAETSGTGCIIQYAQLTNVMITVNGGSPKIDNTAFYGVLVKGGAPIISNNQINGELTSLNFQTVGAVTVMGGSPTIYHNAVTNSGPGNVGFSGGSSYFGFNSVAGRIFLTKGDCRIVNNSIMDGIHMDASSGSADVENNTIIGTANYPIVLINHIPVTFAHNVIVGNGNDDGIHASGDFAIAIINNTITNCNSAISAQGYASSKVTIEQNSVAYNQVGVAAGDNVVILYNTIAHNIIGVRDFTLSTTIVDNNIFANSNFNAYSNSPYNFSLAGNWWGTTDPQQISLSIRDNKSDFNVGFVSFTPFLTAPNPLAPPVPEQTPSPTFTLPPGASSVPTATPLATYTPAPSPTSGPTQSESTPTVSPTASEQPTILPTQPSASPPQTLNVVETAILVVLIVIAALLAVLIYVVARKKR